MPHTTNAIVATAKLIALGDAIRAKADLSDAMTVDEMATAVSNITTGITPSGSTTITANGTYDVTSYASAIVSIPVYAPTPIVDPPIVDPPIVDPPIVDPPIVDPPTVDLISFTILDIGYIGNRTEYSAVSEMTWAEWCESEYNTDGWSASGDLVRLLGMFYVVDVHPRQKIRNGATYQGGTGHP